MRLGAKARRKVQCCDKIKPTELEAVLLQVQTEARKHVAAHPDVLVTSAETKLGIAELRAAVLADSEV